MAVLKYSRQREAIKNYLCNREDHPTADVIYQGIREEFPNISLGTVYRNLSLLIELGEIIKITTDGPDHFDAKVTPHSHFICKCCKNVLDVMVEIPNPIEQVNKNWNFGDIEDYRMEFFGICKACQKNKN